MPTTRDIFLAMCRGDAAQVVRTATLNDRSTAPHEPGMLTWPVHLVASLIQLRRLNEAEKELDRVEDLAHRRGHPSRLAAAARLRGQLADARRDHQTARAAFDQAIASDMTTSRASMPTNEPPRTWPTGPSFGAAGNVAPRSRTPARPAPVTPHSGRPFLQRADQLLNECGVPADSTDTAIEDAAIEDWAGPLTPQERAVATLIATGRTNQQVAEQAVVSAKTIGSICRTCTRSSTCTHELNWSAD